jgi:hypothetical protein
MPKVRVSNRRRNRQPNAQAAEDSVFERLVSGHRLHNRRNSGFGSFVSGHEFTRADTLLDFVIPTASAGAEGSPMWGFSRTYIGRSQNQPSRRFRLQQNSRSERRRRAQQPLDSPYLDCLPLHQGIRFIDCAREQGCNHAAHPEDKKYQGRNREAEPAANRPNIKPTCGWHGSHWFR